MNRMNTVLGSAAITAAFALLPFAASAATLNASSTTGIIINPNGIVRVMGAEVTAVSNGVINAVTTIGNSVLNWIVNISAATKISGDGTANASSTGITAGDKIAFKGTLTGVSAGGLTISATKVFDVTNVPMKITSSHKNENNGNTQTPQATSTGNGHASVSATSTPTFSVGRVGDDDDDDDDSRSRGNASTTARIKTHSESKHGGLNLFGSLRFGKDD